MDRSVRLFVAVELAEDLRERVAAVAGAARLDGFRRVPIGQLHLTLRFLGRMSASRVASVRGALERACQRHAPFDVEVRGGGSFGPRASPQVAWVGIDDATGALGALFASLEEELAREGFEREARAYHPHLTIGRARHGATLDLEALTATPSLGALRVAELVLFESDTRPEGSRYTALLRLPLGAQR